MSGVQLELVSRRSIASRGLGWALSVAGLGVAGWLWWHSVNLPEAGAAPPQPVFARSVVAADSNVVLQPVMRSKGVIVPLLTSPSPKSAQTPSAVANPSAVPANRIAPSRTATLPDEAKFLEAQVALARMGISSGSLDGRIGPQTRSALRAFQQRENLSVTGELDDATQSRLALTMPALTNLVVTSNDLARLLPLGQTWLAKSQQERLDYETVLELVAERTQSNPKLIRQLNANIDWSNAVVGTSLTVPNAELPATTERAAFARIYLAQRVLQAYGTNTNLLAHFPCSIAQRVEKRPVGELRVTVVAPNPNYTFDPEVFPESAEAQELKRKLILQPGPNNPVGVVWIGLDKPGYGIHGTPRPEEVGRTESHGCFRLANWNAEHLLKLAWIGMPVYVEP